MATMFLFPSEPCMSRQVAMRSLGRMTEGTVATSRNEKVDLGHGNDGLLLLLVLPGEGCNPWAEAAGNPAASTAQCSMQFMQFQ